MADYYAILTDIGEAKLARASALGVPLEITHLAVGDGQGQGAQGTPLPDPAQTALRSERRRAPLNTLTTDPANANVLVAEQVIPEDIGGWWIREMGLFDADGDLLAVCNAPPTYKPVLASGSGRTQVVRMQLIVSNTAAVTLRVDPAVVLATRKYVDDGDTLIEGKLKELVVGSGQTYNKADSGQALAAIKRFAGAHVKTLVAGNHTLTAADAGLVVLNAAGGAINVTLPTAASLEGLRFTFARLDVSGNTVTLSRAGNDTIDGATSTPIAAGERRSIISDGASRWLPLVGPASEAAPGVVQLADAEAARGLADLLRVLTPATLGEAFKGGNQSLTVSGYQRLPGGLIIQYGSGILASGSSSAPITYPVAFPTAGYPVLSIDMRGQYMNWQVAFVSSNTSFQVMTASPASNDKTFIWIAVGY